MKLGSLVGRVLLIAAVLLALYALGWSIVNAVSVLRVMGIACLGAYLINPLVRRLQSRGMSRSMAITAVFLVFLTVLALGFYFMVPVIQDQALQVGEQARRFMESSDAHIARLQVVLEEKLPADFMKDKDLKAELDIWLQARADEAVYVVTGLLLTLASNLIYVFILPMMVFLLLQDGPNFYYHLIRAVPNRYFELVQRLVRRIDAQLGGYIRGLLLVSLCVGVVATAGLWLCGMQYFFIIGPLMGLLNTIPIFGPLVGMGVAALAMVIQTGELGSVLGPILVGATAQVLDNVAFTPIAVSRSVNLHPLPVLLATLAGGELFGLVGLLLAVPLTATVKVVWQAVQEARQSRRLIASG